MLERWWKKILRRKPHSLWSIPAGFLWLVSLVYRLGLVLKKRFTSDQIKVTVPVLSVGNITVGGSGKTPIVARLAEKLLADGIRVGVVASGYGRLDPISFVAPGHSVQTMDVAHTGDEVMLLAQQLPNAVFAVDKSKGQAAQKLAEGGQVDVIIVDDGFQHFKLARDLDLVTYDTGLDSRLLKPFPYGLLRESRSALVRADIIFLTRAESAPDADAIKQELRSLSPRASLYRAGFRATEIVGCDRRLPVTYLADKSVLLFAGIGNFEVLKQQVAALSGHLDCALEYSDHQRYDRSLLEQIKQNADRHDSDLVLTTRKDWVKVRNFDFDREFYYLDRLVDFDPGEETLLAEVRTRINLATKGS
jgi:tetraacyldisaccharide 4'-kinase